MLVSWFSLLKLLVSNAYVKVSVPERYKKVVSVHHYYEAYNKNKILLLVTTYNNKNFMAIILFQVKFQIPTIQQCSILGVT